MTYETEIDWEGTLDAFVTRVSFLLKQKGLLIEGSEPNVRLVRDYVARGILEKPLRKGKTAIYGYRHLIQFIACRALINDGWPLKKIADDFQRSSSSEILALIPQDISEDDSLNLISTWKQQQVKSKRKLKSLSTDSQVGEPKYQAEVAPLNISGFLGQQFNRIDKTELRNTYSPPSSDLSQEQTQEQVEALDFVKNIGGEVFLQISSWARETQNLRPFQRGIALNVGRLLGQLGHDWIPSKQEVSGRQAVQAKRIYNEAITLGFKHQTKNKGAFNSLIKRMTRSKDKNPLLAQAEKLTDDRRDEINSNEEYDPFMTEGQLEYFRVKLVNWKESILEESKQASKVAQEEKSMSLDKPSGKIDRAMELRTRDKQRKLVSQIDAALRRIEEGTYGFCEETGEAISLKRLDARPFATLSLEAQERYERKERVDQESMFSSRMKYNLGAKKELIEAQRELGILNSPVEEKNIKSFSIANWLRVQIDDFQLRKMTRRRAKAIAKVVEITLLKNTKLDRGDDNDQV